ncbi:hypothetical protein [Floridanema evergladense]|uniref:LAGLIDADG homing endonuclease n=1 Tax=Floridaenema evergladense BLCC-F167 TaxID=3153639 RepID=A0ABV4WFS1_9CYAN
MTKDWETDEDRMMYKLKVHKKMIGWVIDKLKEEGILAKRTTGNDSSGDILIINEKDAPRVQAIIKQIQIKYNS